MKLSYSKPLALALIGLLSLPAPLAGANGYRQSRPQSTDSVNAPAGGRAQPVPAPASAADPGYTITRSAYQTDQMEVYYPQLNIDNMLTAVLINYQLIQAPGKYKAALAPSAKLSIDYNVGRQSEAVISVVFRGEEVQEDQSRPLLTAVNYNLQSRIPITTNRLIEDSDAARQGVSRLLRQAAAGLPEALQPPAFTGQLDYYLTGQYVVFYYQPDQSAKFVELPLALDRIRPYLAAEYRALPVVSELSDPQRIIADIEKSLPEYQRVSGSRSDGDGQADFTAYVDDTLVYAEEKATSGEYASTTANYYFNDGKLIAYRQNSQKLIIPAGGVASVQREEISLLYDAALNRFDGERKANGTAAELTEDEINDICTAAKNLQQSVAERLAETKAE